MPGYRTHDRVALYAAPVIITASLYILPVQHALVIGAAFLIGNYYLSPDLDIDSVMNHRWGFLRFIWYPYRVIIPHRSVWSHSGPLSALVRCLYLSIFLIPIYPFLALHTYYVLLFYIGVALADTVHSLTDSVL